MHAKLGLVAAAGLLALISSATPLAQQPPVRSNGLTDVPGLRVGHYTLSERPTGCTVILIDGDGAAGGISQRGAAPGTVETDLLDRSTWWSGSTRSSSPAAVPMASTFVAASSATSKSGRPAIRLPARSYRSSPAR